MLHVTEIIAITAVQSSRLPRAIANCTKSSARSLSGWMSTFPDAGRWGSGSIATCTAASSLRAWTRSQTSCPEITSHTPSVAQTSSACAGDPPSSARPWHRTSGTIDITPSGTAILTSKSPNVLDGSSPSTRPSTTRPPAARIRRTSSGALALWSRDIQHRLVAFVGPAAASGTCNITSAARQSPKLPHHTWRPATMQLHTQVPAERHVFFRAFSHSAIVSL
mmetsp:Transcript_41755/g.104946  ORF Transcript_41755/g.104946 Transcript_41755/m.104946 type:complete len:222 (+) Transcript_41755:67-732(+)